MLWGPPGVGKSQAVRQIGKDIEAETGKQVVITDVRLLLFNPIDLRGIPTANADKTLAIWLKPQIFQMNASDDIVNILFLDEIDGLVQNRGRAGHSWEVTQVNELLYQMENFNGIMVGATNFMENLDPAIMRRFTFKLSFDYLDNPGKKIFFERMFNTVLTSEELLRLNNIEQLTPGDFRTVRQSLYYLDDNNNAHRLAGLEQESSCKKQGRRQTGSIGF
jgi:MoxR-like ATPase